MVGGVERVGRLMANAILNFHFDFPHPSLNDVVIFISCISISIFTDQNDVLTQFFYSHRHCVDAPTVLQQSPTIEVATILMQPISPQLHVNASEALEGRWM